MVRRGLDRYTFMDGLKPWLAKELKLKQPSRLHKVMHMTGILEESYAYERHQPKDVGGQMMEDFVSIYKL